MIADKPEEKDAAPAGMPQWNGRHGWYGRHGWNGNVIVLTQNRIQKG